MLELIAAALVAIAIGAAVARWWIVPVPLALTALWVGGAATDTERDREGNFAWELALLSGGTFALAAALGLAVGVIVGRWVRDRRRERRAGAQSAWS